jgi:hypothetical protein
MIWLLFILSVSVNVDSTSERLETESDASKQQ